MEANAYASSLRLRFRPARRKAGGVQGLKAGQNKKRYKARIVGGKVAEDLFNRGLCLPSGTAMTEKNLDRVISVILSCKK
jgi:dTDP-4-amino-4,6-dideoxygalactose transaminase